MLGRGTDVPSVDAMGCHVGSLAWGNVDDDTSARWGQWVLVEIVIAVEACVGREARLATGGAQEIESDVSLRHEEIPFGEWEFGIAGGETRAEMIFPCLNGAFGGVSTVAVRRDALEIDVVLFEGFLEFIGALVVKDVKFGCEAVVLQFFVKLGPGGGELAGLARFEGLGEDGVAVIVV